MTNAELLVEVKTGLGIPAASTSHDGVLMQKLVAVKGFMTGAGVSDVTMATDEAIGALVLGVGDIWSLAPGEVKFSQLFYNLLSQLAIDSSLVTVTGSPTDGATNVAVDVEPALTFNQRIKSWTALMYVYDDTDQEISLDAELDVTEKVLTITPSANLAAATKYAIIISAISHLGPVLDRTVISFTTV